MLASKHFSHGETDMNAKSAQILAELASQWSQAADMCGECPALDFTCAKTGNSCNDCKYARVSEGACVAPGKCPEQRKCAAALLKYAQWKARKPGD